MNPPPYAYSTEQTAVIQGTFYPVSKSWLDTICTQLFHRRMYDLHKPGPTLSQIKSSGGSVDPDLPARSTGQCNTSHSDDNTVSHPSEQAGRQIFIAFIRVYIMSLLAKAKRMYERDGFLPLLKAGYHYSLQRLGISSVNVVSPPETKQQIVDEFHKLYYGHDEQTWHNTYWMGTEIRKCPLDCWIYQEILVETEPDVIIETGTAKGGSALFLANLCDIVGNGHIYTIDIEIPDEKPKHERITYLEGSSTGDQIFTQIRKTISEDDSVMVILDSDHSKGHVLEELNLYNEFVTAGCYLIVEDTNVNGHPVKPSYGPGPKEAVDDFLTGRSDFVVDKTREKFFMTKNPGGYLQRVNR